MQLDKETLMGFLKTVDARLKTRIEVTAVGGTAMTLLGLKSSTLDIDFNIDGKAFHEFKSTLERMPHGYRIDLYSGGLIFSQQLSDDYKEKRIRIETGLPKLGLYALHPLDIIVTKIGRLNDRDVEDVASCIKEYQLTKEMIVSRARETQYVGRQENYDANLKYVLKNLV